MSIHSSQEYHMRRQKRHRTNSPRSIRPVARPSPWSVFAQHGRVYPRVPLSLPPSPDADQDALASYVLAMAPIMVEIMWLIRDWDQWPWKLAELQEQWTQQHGHWPETSIHYPEATDSLRVRRAGLLLRGPMQGRRVRW